MERTTKKVTNRDRRRESILGLSDEELADKLAEYMGDFDKDHTQKTSHIIEALRRILLRK